jgi:hypothetical protein
MNKNKQIVEVLWYDIVSEIRVKKEKILETPLNELVIICTTIGILEKMDKKFILLKTEDAGDELDYTVIPKGCIINITKLKRRLK